MNYLEESTPLEINDFLANFLSRSIHAKEGIKISPLEVEFLYFFKKIGKPIEEKEIIELLQNMSPDKITKLLKNMEKNKLIIKKSPYRLDEKGNFLLARFSEIQRSVEPIIKNDSYFNRMYHASSVSIKVG